MGFRNGLEVSYILCARMELDTDLIQLRNAMVDCVTT
jgi:hypothetical protein